MDLLDKVGVCVPTLFTIYLGLSVVVVCFWVVVCGLKIGSCIKIVY